MINYVEAVNFISLFLVKNGVEVYWKMAFALNLKLCIKPLTCKIKASISLSVSSTNKQNEKPTFVCCFAFWTLHNNLVSNFDF